MTVRLTKGGSISLQKGDGGTLTRVRLGLGWTAAKKRGIFGVKNQSIDLDASALLFDRSGDLVDQVWFRQLTSKDGSVTHTGDNRVGGGDLDDESIRVDLVRVPSHIATLVFTVNSFTGQTFAQIESARVRIIDESAGDAEVARYELAGSGPHTAQIMAKVGRLGKNSWSITALGIPTSGRTFHDLLPAIAGQLTKS